MINYEDMTNIIPKGKENRIKSSEITRNTGLVGNIVRKTVNEMRSDLNIPICSDKDGYFIATEADELTYTIAQLSSRIESITRARDGLLKAKKLVEGEKKNAAC